MPKKKKEMKKAGKKIEIKQEYLNKMIVYSILIGVAITLATGIFSAPGITGANLWGYPIAWLTQPVLPPNYSAETSIVAPGFFIDVVFWSFISFLVLFILYKKK